MTIAEIPEELRAFVEREMARGRYRSIDELLAESLRVLRDSEAFLEERRDALRAEIEIGVAEAERGELLDGEVVLEDLRRDLARRASEG